MIKKIPNSFIIYGHEILVNFKDKLKSNNYGEYNDVLEEITLAKNIEVDGELIPLREEQIMTTFLHELMHCFQFHTKCTYDEQESQIYSGLMYEFLNTSKYDV